MGQINLNEINLKDRNSYEFIPLGLGCSVANFIRRTNLRKNAFPFDWTITPMQSALRLIENDFEKFLHRSNLWYGEPNAELRIDNGERLQKSAYGERVWPVICTNYNIMFIHDF